MKTIRTYSLRNFYMEHIAVLIILIVLFISAAAAAAKSLQSCPTLCDLHHSWDSPGKNTGVGCHFLLQCMKVNSENEVTQLCPTLNDPIDCSLPGSSIHGIFQARGLEWGVIAFSVFISSTYLSYNCKLIQYN